MGSIFVPEETNVPLSDNPKARSGGHPPAVTTRNPVTARHISDLRELVKRSDDGSILLAEGDDGYEESLRRWSRASEKRAGAVLLAKSASAIAITLRYASQETLDIAVRGGAHSTAGTSSTSGGLVIDLSSMRAVKVDPATKVLTIQGGAQWCHVDDAAWEHGLATVGGTVADTGVGGLTLGGGYGWLTGGHGLVIDNLISCEVVLASGEIVRASKDQNDDLFWGLRGAGQNFGVVTEFVIQAWDQGNVWAGLIAFPPERLREVVEVLNEIPDQMAGRGGAMLGFGRPPPAGGQVMVLVLAFYDGSEEEGRAGFKRLIDLGPVLNMAASIPYNKLNRLMDAPDGKRVSTKSSSVAVPLRVEFVQSTLDAYARFTSEVPGTGRSLVLYEMLSRSNIQKIAVSDTAFANRGSYTNVVVVSMWESAEQDDRARSWAREMAQMIKEERQTHKDPERPEDEVMVYGNYDHEGKSRDTFGINYPRLQDLKARYDRDNMFDKLFPVIPAV